MLAKIRATANQYNISYIKTSAKLIDDGSISGRGGASLKSYLEFITRCKEFIEDNPLSDFWKRLSKPGLVAYHAKEPGEKGKTRVENLEELVSVTTNLNRA